MSLRESERIVPKKLKKADLEVGMVLYREINGKIKVREVLEFWDGSHLLSEIRSWGVYISTWGTTSDWDRARFLQRGGSRSPDREDRCTRAGLARWAHGLVEEDD